MAKKYQAIETRVHPLTYTVIGLLVVLIAVLIIALRPTAKENFYNSYLSRTQDQNFQKKLPMNNNYILIDNLNDSWFGIKKGMYSIGKSDKQLSIIFIGTPNDEVSVKVVPNVYARLYGTDKTDPKIDQSELYTNLDNKVKLYYFELPKFKEDKTLESITKHYDDEDIVLSSFPLVLALYDNEIISHLTFGEEDNFALKMFNFYNDLLELESLEGLLN
ncbi:MAG: hypothetical protein WC907_01255 [Acholeplasmataceae bacterium]